MLLFEALNRATEFPLRDVPCGAGDNGKSRDQRSAEEPRCFPEWGNYGHLYCEGLIVPYSIVVRGLHTERILPGIEMCVSHLSPRAPGNPLFLESFELVGVFVLGRVSKFQSCITKRENCFVVPECDLAYLGKITSKRCVLIERFEACEYYR